MGISPQCGSVDWWNRVVERHFTNEQWKDNFRMEKTIFYLCEQLRPRLQRRDTKFRKALPVSVRVAIALWRLATHNTNKTIGHLFGVAKSTVCGIINEVCQAMIDCLLHKMIKFPKGIKP